MTEVRNVNEDYKQAMIREWEAYAGSGRTERADYVAGVLLAEYDYDVTGGSEQEKAVIPSAPENTAAVKPPEAAVEPKPETVRQELAPAKKTAAKKTTAAAPTKN
ncbi:hypothetical protein OG352_05215 [Streptomyces sp. NBC_01485]|uniref:hypothetical protein n=1 Tax=Streptomyces sp. NBC_01485 TaxID=2903884 RepID=UPI002E3658ED|nr:hypothetical protein [Streptomyces sp. NBC_01485]